jgi:hypothetical protein
MGFLPPDYRSSSAPGPGQAQDEDKKKRYFEPKNLKDGESTTLRLCGTHDTGHVISGWSYFTEAGRPRRFPKFPENYLEDIGLTYEGKNSGSGEKDRPKYFLSFVALRREVDDFVVATIPQKQCREQLEEILSMEDYQFLPSGMANFYLTLKRKGEKTDTSYTLVPTLKAPSKADQTRWAEAASGIWLPALYEGADPFAGQPEEEYARLGDRAVGLPPTHRDAHGADHEVAVAVNAEALPAEGW